MRVLVTGATGFVGTAVRRSLDAAGHEVICAVRKPSGLTNEVVVGEIDGQTDWSTALRHCDAVVHLAARVHMMNDASSDPEAQYTRTNRDATQHLAEQAAARSVKRLVFVSSIKVNGNGKDSPYRETDSPEPDDAYGRSKWEAEQALKTIATRTGLEVVVLRPPLVYGPGVKANFLALLAKVDRGWPLPLGSIKNRRSLIFVDNLADAITRCTEHPNAAGQTFLLDDGAAISTPDLVRALAQAAGRKPRLLPLPVPVMKVLGSLLGKRSAIDRLTGSLWVDSCAIREALGWTPPASLQQGLEKTIQASQSQTPAQRR